jgi:hypothetical protein
MNCDIQVQIFKGEVGSGEAVSSMTHKSIVDYAMYLINSSSDAELKTLLVDLLNYGAEAQIYFEHDVNELANRLLTKEQQALATPTVDYSKADASVEGNYAYGPSVTLADNIYLNFYFMNLANVDKSKLDVVITYKAFDASAETTLVLSGDGLKFMNGGLVMAEVSTLSAADINTVVKAELRYDGTVVSRITSNIAYYCAYAIVYETAESDICAMMLKYGQSAYKYFN